LPLSADSSDGAQPADRIREGELFAGHSGDETAAPDLSPSFEPAVDHQQVAPGRGPGLAGQEALENHAVAAEICPGGELGRSVGRAIGRSVRFPRVSVNFY
jgi:hypothetical protein